MFRLRGLDCSHMCFRRLGAELTREPTLTPRQTHKQYQHHHPFSTGAPREGGGAGHGPALPADGGVRLPQGHAQQEPAHHAQEHHQGTFACLLRPLCDVLSCVFVCVHGAWSFLSRTIDLIPRLTITQTTAQSTTKQVRSYQQKSLRMMFGNGRARSGAFCVLGRI